MTGGRAPLWRLGRERHERIRIDKMVGQIRPLPVTFRLVPVLIPLLFGSSLISVNLLGPLCQIRMIEVAEWFPRSARHKPPELQMLRLTLQASLDAMPGQIQHVTARSKREHHLTGIAAAVATALGQGDQCHMLVIVRLEHPSRVIHFQITDLAQLNLRVQKVVATPEPQPRTVIMRRERDLALSQPD